MLLRIKEVEQTVTFKEDEIMTLKSDLGLAQATAAQGIVRRKEMTKTITHY